MAVNGTITKNGLTAAYSPTVDVPFCVSLGQTILGGLTQLPCTVQFVRSLDSGATWSPVPLLSLTGSNTITQAFSFDWTDLVSGNQYALLVSGFVPGSSAVTFEFAP